MFNPLPLAVESLIKFGKKNQCVLINIFQLGITAKFLSSQNFFLPKNFIYIYLWKFKNKMKTNRDLTEMSGSKISFELISRNWRLYLNRGVTCWSVSVVVSSFCSKYLSILSEKRRLPGRLYPVEFSPFSPLLPHSISLSTPSAFPPFLF